MRCCADASASRPHCCCSTHESLQRILETMPPGRRRQSRIRSVPVDLTVLHDRLTTLSEAVCLSACSSSPPQHIDERHMLVARSPCSVGEHHMRCTLASDVHGSNGHGCPAVAVMMHSLTISRARFGLSLRVTFHVNKQLHRSMVPRWFTRKELA